MKLYHGTHCRNIKNFDVKYSRDKTDFGKGIYFTTNFEQAKEWSCRNKIKRGAVYECDIDLSEFEILNYDEPDEDLLYVLYLCRIGIEEIALECVEKFDSADIVIGTMLDGGIQDFNDWAEAFNKGDITEDEFCTKVRLYGKQNNQICVKTEDTLENINQSITKIYYTKKSVNGSIKVEKIRSLSAKIEKNKEK